MPEEEECLPVGNATTQPDDVTKCLLQGTYFSPQRVVHKPVKVTPDDKLAAVKAMLDDASTGAEQIRRGGLHRGTTYKEERISALPAKKQLSSVWRCEETSVYSCVRVVSFFYFIPGFVLINS
ncbi:hypothetical protein JGF38_23610 [Salmonella enterica subsp. enterica serovar Hadar]|nr:hypothetical protein [Salmonella enterica subsp. enterica serovar Hadar]